MADDTKDDLPKFNYSKGEFQAIEQTTRPIKHEGRISWQIDDFFNLARIETRMDSMPMEFTFGKSLFKFQLELHLQVKDEPDSIGLYLTSLNDSEVKLSYNLSAIDAFGAEIKSMPVVVRKIEPKSRTWGFADFLSKKVMENKAVSKSKSGSVKFICDFTLYLDSVSKLHNEEARVSPKKGFRFVDAASYLWKSGLLNDFAIVCEGKQFNCHKAILASRSTYFKTMFNSALKKDTEYLLEVKDASAITVDNFIKFVYTDKLSDESQFTTELLILAERYQFEALKLACEKAISKTINLVSMLKLFFLFRCQDVIRVSIGCWQAFLVCHYFPDLQASVFWG
jgi:hypothetical protein